MLSPKAGRKIASLGPIIVLLFSGTTATAKRHDCTPYGKWAIPGYIVMRESHGRNIPNASGSTASGYYQILDSTWIGAGGHVRKRHGRAVIYQAMNHSKRAQDCLASRLWAGGRGSSHWALTR